ncbi:MAG: UvrD-helicase domain-containing protein [Oleispira sp.]|nr:UvrD-helicase domain-containing protein [Oleispira sp.]
MNLIDESRIRAAELHQKALDRGCDPFDLLLLVSNEAKERGITLAPRPIQNPQLCGGEAVFDYDENVVFFLDSGSAFERAFRIAHEIGHAEFSNGPAQAVLERADHTFTPDLSDDVLGPVIEYGRRQRREVQMDLFAREFLVPRTSVRRLHIDDGLTCLEISQKFSAPENVVAVQLYDALLLPPIEAATPEPSSPKPLNELQQKAAHWEQGPLLLEAGPGTGKTQTLVGRIDFLRKKGIDPERVLVLTYSNKAAFEMQSRIVKQWPEAAGSTWIGTFHAYGYDIIRGFFHELGLTDNPKLLDQIETVALLEDEFARLDLVHFKDLYDPTNKLMMILSAISRAKDEVVGFEKYQQLADAMYESAVSPEEIENSEKCLEVAKFYRRYEELKTANSYLDFGDLVGKAVKFLEGNLVAKEAVAAKWDHVLIDEYQDVNRASIRLLKALKPDGQNLWVVGDARQSIYRFRGASSFNVPRFCSDDFPLGDSLQLSQNYRSSQEICDTFSYFGKEGLSVSGPVISAEAHRGLIGERPVHIAVNRKIDEVPALAQEIREGLEDGFSFKDQVVLCRGNERLAELAKELENEGIPTLFLGPLFERSEIRDLLSLLSLIVDPRAASLVRVATLDQFTMPLEDVERISALIKLEKPNAPLAWIDLALECNDISTQGRGAIERIRDALGAMNPKINPSTALHQIVFNQTRIVANITAASDPGDQTAGIAVWQFQNFLRNLPQTGEGYPIKRALDHIRQMMKLSDDRALRELPAAAQSIDAVRLMTMHGSKGLEFPVVHMPSLTRGSLPGNYQAHKTIAPPPGMILGETGTGHDPFRKFHDEEQACLFFVALSRAESRLRLYSPKFQMNGTTNLPRTPYLDLLSGFVEWRDFKGPDGANALDNHPPVPIDLKTPVRVRLSHVEEYNKCPRRFLYSHVLNLAGRRARTGFIKMHDALHRVLDIICHGDQKIASWDDVEPAFEAIWNQHGPNEEGYADDYRLIARRLVNFYLSQRINGDPSQLDVQVDVGNFRIDVTFNERTIGDDPSHQKLRRVRTGRKTSKIDKGQEAAILIKASELDPTANGAEFLFLSDEVSVPLNMNPKPLATQLRKLEELSTELIAGKFPPIAGQRCPTCPHYFFCGKLPSGKILKKSIV